MKPIIAAICGGSGSGKTTFVSQLVEKLGNDKVLVLAADDYYFDLSHISLEQRHERNYDHPDAIEWDLMQKDLELLRRNLSVQRPHYNFATHTRDGSSTVSPKPIVLVDGILAMVPEDVRKKVDLSVFIDTDDDIRFIRRLRRDIKSRGRSQEQVIDQYLKTVRPMFKDYVRSQRDRCNLVVNGNDWNQQAVYSVAGAIEGLMQIESQT